MPRGKMLSEEKELTMDTKSSSLDWRIPLKSADSKIRYIFSKALLTDLTIHVTDGECAEKFKVHSLVLSLASSAFEAMISSDFKERTEQLITISDISPDIFNLLLSFIYGRKIRFSHITQARDLYVAADKYLIYNLKHICIRYIEKNINVANACMCYEFANFYDEAYVRKFALKLMTNNTQEVVTNTTFSYADIKSVLKILEEKLLKIKEIDLFHAVESWARLKDKSETFRTFFCESIIPKFYFQDMTVEEFNSGPAKSDFLTKDQAAAIRLNLLSSEVDLPMPKGFMTGRRHPFSVLPGSLPPFQLDSDDEEDSEEKEAWFSANIDTVIKDFSSGLNRTITFKTNRDILLTGMEVYNGFAPGRGFIKGATIKIIGLDSCKTCTVHLRGSYTSAEISIISLPYPMVISGNKRYEIRIKMDYGCRIKALDFRGQILRTKSIFMRFLPNICNDNYKLKPSVSPLTGLLYRLI